MALNAPQQALRQQRIAASDRREVSDPARPAVPTQSASMAFCHVRAIHDDTLSFVPVRRFKRSATWAEDGSFVYDGGEEMVAVWPGRIARHYRVFVTLADEWTPDAFTCLLQKIGGVWHLHHPQLFTISQDVMTAMIQSFGVTSCFPSPGIG